jgi:hypothetical protein
VIFFNSESQLGRVEGKRKRYSESLSLGDDCEQERIIAIGFDYDRFFIVRVNHLENHDNHAKQIISTEKAESIDEQIYGIRSSRIDWIATERGR